MDARTTRPTEPHLLHSFWNHTTNLLACVWAAVAAYILLASLLVTHHFWYVVAAVFPLVSAWATLERRRWGRMALMGLSLATLSIFVALAGYFAVSGQTWHTGMQAMGDGASSLIVAYGISAAVAIALLALAAITGLWLCLPNVAEVFNHNKRAALAKAQPIIATVLVGCWGAAIAVAPLLGDSRHSVGSGNYPRPGLRPASERRYGSSRTDDHSVSSRATRSALSDTRR